MEFLALTPRRHPGRLAVACCLVTWLTNAEAQSLAPLCRPVVENLTTVVTAAQRNAAGSRAIPPITDLQFGFAWPDSEFGVFKTDAGYTFFASDGAHHNPNNKYGSVTRTLGTLDNPVGTAPP